MTWKCPKCRLVLTNYMFPIYCRCGNVDDGERDTPKLKTLTNLDERQKRRAICRECDRFSKTNYEMCCDVDMGCRKSYRRLLQDASASCPHGYWEKAVNHGD